MFKLPFRTTLKSPLKTNAFAQSLLLVTVMVTPFLMAPIAINLYQPFKHLWLLLVSVLLLIGLAINTLVEKKIKLTFSPLTIAISLFGLSMVTTTFLANKYPVEDLMGLGGVYLCWLIIVAAGSHLLSKPNEKLLQLTMVIVGVVLGMEGMAGLMGFNAMRSLLNAVGIATQDGTMYTLTGDVIISLQLLVLSAVALVNKLFQFKRQPTASTQNQLYLHLAGLVVVTIGLVANAISLFPTTDSGLVVIDPRANLVVATNTLQTTRTALIGVGHEEFTHAYLAFKPDWVNQTRAWEEAFARGTDLPLDLLVSTGVLGFLTWVFLSFQIVQKILKAKGEPSVTEWLLVATLVLSLLTPQNSVVLALQAVILAFWLAQTRVKKTQINLPAFMTQYHQTPIQPLKVNAKTKVIGVVMAMMVLVLAGAMAYFGGRGHLANFQFKRSMVLLSQGQAVAAYELQQHAIRLNPYQDLHHRQYALTNLAIATALANKADLTEEERAQALQLIQQSIREARFAVETQPGDSDNHLTLARVYQNLIGVAETADQWAVTTYVNAVQLDPTNPLLRLDLGAIFYRANSYDQAAQLFQQAVDLKPDLPNSWYNLANAQRMAEQYNASINSYQQLLGLVEADTPAYQQVQAEINIVQGLVDAQAENSAATTMDSTEEAIKEDAADVAPNLVQENLSPTSGNTSQDVTSPLE